MRDLAVNFLRGPARDAQALYILGDLFEYWIGDDPADATARSVLEALAAAAAGGVQVAFMHGNRDFMLGETAARRGGFSLLTDPTVIDLFGRRALLMHGDTLCTDDKAYQRYRRVIRAAPILALLRRLPLALRHRIARSIRAKSETEKQRKSMVLMDVNANAVEQAFTVHGVDLMIHGHTHRPAHHRLDVAGHACERIVLADWYSHGSYLHATRQGVQVMTVA